MSLSAWSGPLVAFGSTNPNGTYNSQRGPSLFDQGVAIMDPTRGYIPGGAANSKAYGFYGVTNMPVLDGIPAASGTAVLAALQNVPAGLALTLVSSSTAAANSLRQVMVGRSVVNASTGLAVTGLLGIDILVDGSGNELPNYTAYGQDGTINLYNPQALFARTVSITASGGAAGQVFTVRGYDWRGAPMTEQITAVTGTTVAGVKAFKYIASITGTSAEAQNYSAGLTFVFGLPLFLSAAAFASGTFVGGALATVTAGVTTAATATSADVRGTTTVSSGTPGTSRLTVFETPLPANVASATGLFGVAQYTA